MTRSAVITCAPTCGIHTPTMSPHLPVTPYEWSVLAAGRQGADRVTF